MLKAVLALTIASACLVGCSQSAPPDSSSAGQASPAAAPESAQPQAPPSAAPSNPAPSNAAPSSAAPSNAAPSRTAPSTAPPSTAAPQSAAPAREAAPDAPTSREVTIPAGTTMSVRVLSTLASNSSKVEDTVRGTLSRPVVVDGATALPSGTQVIGSVTEANESGRVKGRASLAFRFDRLELNGESMRIQTGSIRREAAADRKGDLTKGGIGAGVGAIVGGVIGGGKGAAVGAAAGGSGAVLATKGKEVEIPSGTVVTVRLQEPLTVTIPVR